jgi:hypothetical protein
MAVLLRDILKTLTPLFGPLKRKELKNEPLAKVGHSVIPAKAGIQKRLKILDSGSRFACPE